VAHSRPRARPRRARRPTKATPAKNAPKGKALLYEQALKRRSAAIYPALVLALNCGLRDKELRDLQWGRIHLDEAYLVVGETKTEGGTGRTIPLNSVALEALMAMPSGTKPNSDN